MWLHCCTSHTARCTSLQAEPCLPGFVRSVSARCHTTSSGRRKAWASQWRRRLRSRQLWPSRRSRRPTAQSRRGRTGRRRPGCTEGVCTAPPSSPSAARAVSAWAALRGFCHLHRAYRVNRAIAEARMMHLTHIRANACTRCVIGAPPTAPLSESARIPAFPFPPARPHRHGVLWRAHGMAARQPTHACCAPYFAVCRRPRCDRWRVRAGKRPSTRRNVACPSRRATRRRGVGP